MEGVFVRKKGTGVVKLGRYLSVVVVAGKKE